jgi:hypothetical protein
MGLGLSLATILAASRPGDIGIVVDKRCFYGFTERIQFED